MPLHDDKSYTAILRFSSKTAELSIITMICNIYTVLNFGPAKRFTAHTKDTRFKMVNVTMQCGCKQSSVFRILDLKALGYTGSDNNNF